MTATSRPPLYGSTSGGSGVVSWPPWRAALSTYSHPQLFLLFFFFFFLIITFFLHTHLSVYVPQFSLYASAAFSLTPTGICKKFQGILSLSIYIFIDVTLTFCRQYIEIIFQASYTTFNNTISIVVLSAFTNIVTHNRRNIYNKFEYCI